LEGKDPEARVGLIDEVLFTPRLLRLDILGGADNGLEELIFCCSKILSDDAEMIINRQMKFADY